ncbi:hypothetical protein MASR2M15_27630 [Anaerolineales bacterium]
MNDLELLKKYEPIIYFNKAEMFYPCAVDRYIEKCSLWIRDPNGKKTLIEPANQLNVDRLAEYEKVLPGYTLYLQYVDQPLRGLQYLAWVQKRPRFQAIGRLTRVYMFSRILDSLFDLSLQLRGTVPGGTTAQAQIQYEQSREKDPRFVYYGRVKREGGYIVLHYLYFYVMNNWRTGFFGINDHEADWEQVFIYLSDEGLRDPQPMWVAYASHDFSGDDLRRRWDDPDIRIEEETHPVIYAGAGSHASYFQQGEYLMNSEIRALAPLNTFIYRAKKFWAMIGQGSHLADDIQTRENLFSIPFVDYARGDGVRLGIGDWHPILIGDDTDWVNTYRGLWGLDTNDVFGGERAPAGPKFNRDGSTRQAWHNPLGWAGLLKVEPPQSSIAVLREKIALLQHELMQVDTGIKQLRDDIRMDELEVKALNASAHLIELYKRKDTELALNEVKLNDLYKRKNELIVTINASNRYLADLESGKKTDPKSHIRHHHHPEPPVQAPSRLLEFWAALSSGLLLFALAIFLLFNTTNWFTGVFIVIILFIAIEAALRRNLGNFLLNAVIMLSIIASLVLVGEFLRLFLLIILVIFGSRLIWENLQEINNKQ